MRRFKHKMVLKILKQVSFPLVFYVQHIDCLAFESIWKKRKVEKCVLPEIDVTLDIAVIVIPCLSVFPISIVTFCRVIPWAL